jgi:hypothetical protein
MRLLLVAPERDGKHVRPEAEGVHGPGLNGGQLGKEPGAQALHDPARLLESVVLLAAEDVVTPIGAGFRCELLLVIFVNSCWGDNVVGVLSYLCIRSRTSMVGLMHSYWRHSCRRRSDLLNSAKYSGLDIKTIFVGVLYLLCRDC